jgi:hypothetical protein
VTKKSKKREDDFAIFTVIIIVLSIMYYHHLDDTTKLTIQYYVYIIEIIGLIIIATIIGYFYYRWKNKNKKNINKLNYEKYIKEKNKISTKKQIPTSPPLPVPTSKSITVPLPPLPVPPSKSITVPTPPPLPPLPIPPSKSIAVPFKSITFSEPTPLSEPITISETITSPTEPITYPIQKTNENLILTKAESNFNEYLKKIIPPNLIINYKTRLVDVVNQKLIPIKHLHKALPMHLDFILIDNTGKIILAIELDDSSHNTPKAKYRDSIKNDALKKANIPLLRIHTAVYYNLSELKKSIQNKINFDYKK